MYGVGNLTHTTYAILRIWLCLKTTKSSMNKAGYVRCATCVITRGVSSIRVSSRRLVVPTQDMNLQARHVSFLRRAGCCKGKGAETKKDVRFAGLVASNGRRREK